MKLLDSEQAAEYLGVHPVTLRRRVREGKVPFLRPFGGQKTRLYFEEEALDRLLQGSRRGPDVFGDSSE